MASCSCQRILMRRTRWLQRSAQHKVFQRHNSEHSATDFRLYEIQQEPIISSIRSIKPKRDRYTVLRALASTVHPNVDQPPLGAIDDFFLLSDDPEFPLQAQIEGQKVAEQIISSDRYKGLTKFRQPVPEWSSRASYAGATRDAKMLKDMLNDTRSRGRDIVKLYDELSIAGADIPISLHNKFLDYVGFHSLSSGRIEMIDPVQIYDTVHHSGDRVVQMVSVPSTYAGMIFGRATLNLKRIVDRSGCSLSLFSKNMETLQDHSWTMKGTIDQINACKTLLYNRFIDWPADGIKLQKQTTDEKDGKIVHTHEVTFSSGYGRDIIGKNGETVRSITETTGCNLSRTSRMSFPEEDPDAIALWKLSGTPEQVEACTQELRKIVQVENVSRPKKPDTSKLCLEFSEEIFEKLLLEADASTYEVFIFTLLKHSSSTAAFKIFVDMNSKGYPGSKFLCDRLLSSIKSIDIPDEEEKWQLVETITKHMNQHNISPDLETCNLILEVIAKLPSPNDSSKAIEMLREMHKLNIAPTLESFISVLEAEKSAKTSNLNLVTSVLDKLETFSLTENPNNTHFFNLAMELARRSSDSSDIEQIGKKIDNSSI